MTPREEQIAARVAAGESVSAALRAVGANPHSASYRRRLKPGGDMHAALMLAWRRHGVSLNRVAQRHREALDALETKLHVHEGHVIERTDLVAHDVRLRATELVYKVAGVLRERDDTSESQAPVAVQINLHVGASGNGNGTSHAGSHDDPGLSAVRVTLHPDGGNGHGA